MSLRRRRQANRPDVDISPLIDVVFILLIFFMVTTTFVKDAQVELQRPGASSGTPANTDAIRVSIDRHGALFLGDQPVKTWMLQNRVRDQLRSTGQDTVVVVADRQTPTQRLIDVIDQCRLAGAVDVGVLTDAEGA